MHLVAMHLKLAFTKKAIMVGIESVEGRNVKRLAMRWPGSRVCFGKSSWENRTQND